MCEVCKGKTYLVPSGEVLHLFVVLTNKCNNHMHMLVPLCSIRPPRRYDNTCVITVDEKAHPFIRHDSYIKYAQMQVRHVNVIKRYIENGSYIEREDIDVAVFERVCEGVNGSPHIPRGIRKQFNEWPD